MNEYVRYISVTITVTVGLLGLLFSLVYIDNSHMKQMADKGYIHLKGWYPKDILKGNDK